MKNIIFVVILSAFFINPALAALKNYEPQAIFLEDFEVIIKKRGLGIVFEPKLYFFSQQIPFEKGDSPQDWNLEWYGKIKPNTK